MYSVVSLFQLSAQISVIEDPGTWFQTHGLNILIIIFGAWIFRHVAFLAIHSVMQRAVRSHFGNEADRKKRLATLEGLIDAVLKIGTIAVAILMIISELGINTAPILASAGVVGIALGIGAQSLIRDFMSGFFIIAENQYRVGDVVEISTLVGNVKVTGTVQAITVRTTIVRDQDGLLHHVPNGSIVVASNKTFGLGRINEDIIVDPDTDLDKLEKVIAEVGINMAKEEAFERKIKKAPTVGQIVGYNDRGIIVKIIADTLPGSQWEVKTAFYKRLRPELKKNKIKVLFNAPTPAS
ncbi:MAG: moderate conductance mechanosensitive channel [Patescibacteria group bacterium]|nr:moderate conductance mechanosensitive channel [Patescibacteria group bacterium]